MYEVYLTDAALRDLEEIDDYIVASDSPQKAEYVLGRIEQALLSLAGMPKRGNYPKELAKLWYQGVQGNLLQALPYRVSCVGQKSLCLPDR